jgi:hypothetical protein
MRRCAYAQRQAGGLKAKYSGFLKSKRLIMHQSAVDFNCVLQQPIGLVCVQEHAAKHAQHAEEQVEDWVSKKLLGSNLVHKTILRKEGQNAIRESKPEKGLREHRRIKFHHPDSPPFKIVIRIA